jgi:hypothetical protein
VSWEGKDPGEKPLKNIIRRLSCLKSSRGILAILILAPVAFLLFQGTYSPDISFIYPHGGASWIMAPSSLSTFSRTDPGEALFEKDFTLDPHPEGPIRVRLKALRKAQLYVNGRPVFPGRSGRDNWKTEIRADLSPWLRPGPNTLRVHVQNPLGPALLWLKVEGPNERVVTDETWKSGIDPESMVPAILADDTRKLPDSLNAPTPFQALQRQGPRVLLLFAFSLGLWAIGRLFFQGRRLRFLPGVTLAGITGFWVYLFFAKMALLPPDTGFDAVDHLDYLARILRKQTLPLAMDGWSMFHPPFFYLVSAAVLNMAAPLLSSTPPFLILKTIPFLCGVGNVFLAHSLGRMMFPNDPVRVFWVVLAAGTLPMNVYLSAYVGNEPLHAFLVSLALVLAVGVWRTPKTRIVPLLSLGFILGLALLTKMTAWVLIPIVGIFLFYKWFRVEREPFPHAATKLGFWLLVLGGVAGWYYLRNLIYFGHPLVVNWNLPGMLWWQDPGFHTPGYYLSFGDVLRYPYFAGFRSFWGSLYATFWGDGMIGGHAFWVNRPPIWNYDFMSITYLWALPAGGVFMVGLFRNLQAVWKGPDGVSWGETAFLLLVLYGLGIFLWYSTLKVPIYSQAKAFYALSAMGPLTWIFASGLGTVRDWLKAPNLWPVRALLFGWLGTLFILVGLSFGL